jgi:rhodanese-related sulfurtransferase
MNNWQHLTVAAFRAFSDKGEAQVIDIRDATSFEGGHIPGARLIGAETIESFIRSEDKSRPTVVCCYHGHSSQLVAEYLGQQNFTHVYSLDGGYAAWARQDPAAE